MDPLTAELTQELARERAEEKKKGNKKYLKKITELTATPELGLQKRITASASVAQDTADTETATRKCFTAAQEDTVGGMSTTLSTTAPGQTHADIRKERNKESAKNTRRRKKIYIELLENKISELKMELTFIKDQIKLSKINRNTDNIMKIIYGFKNLKERGDSDPLETARDHLELMKNKSNIQVPERRQLLQSHFEQFREHCKTPFFRYFTVTALKGEDFFAADKKAQTSEVFDYLNEELCLTKGQLAELKSFQKSFVHLANKFKGYNEELDGVLGDIFGVSAEMDLLVEKIVSSIAFQTVENFYSLFQNVVCLLTQYKGSEVETLINREIGIESILNANKIDFNFSIFEDGNLGKRTSPTE